MRVKKNVQKKENVVKLIRKYCHYRKEPQETFIGILQS